MRFASRRQNIRAWDVKLNSDPGHSGDRPDYPLSLSGIAVCLPCSLGFDQYGSANDMCRERTPRFSSRKVCSEGEGDSMRLFMKFLRDETGATAIEYGLIAAGISLAIISVVNGMGARLNTKFTSLNNSLK
jgi:pilus assembly protein Flp/PilA